LAAYTRGGRDATKAVLLRSVLPGVAMTRAASLGERYGIELLRRIRPSMREAITWHRDQGHRLILVSASLTLYLDAFGHAAGFEQILATRLAQRDGQLSGELDGANVRGPEKARLLAAAIGGPAELWVYGDSPGDKDMLAMADHPLLVGRRGWRPEPRTWLHRRAT
jgi:HAD superfamily hydrolase (TIGR01490 family)